MSNNAKKVQPMTHDERLRLINRPFPTVQIHGGKPWGGAVTDRLNDLKISHGGPAERDYQAPYDPDINDNRY
jgi:hypothetical protein